MFHLRDISIYTYLGTAWGLHLTSNVNLDKGLTQWACNYNWPFRFNKILRFELFKLKISTIHEETIRTL